MGHRSIRGVALATPVLLVASVLLPLVAGAAGATTSTTLTATADTYVDESAPATTFGTGRRLVVADAPTRQALLMFDLGAAYTGPIDTATLRLHVGKGSAKAGGTVAASSDTGWLESTVKKSSVSPRIDGASWTHRPDVDGDALGTIGRPDADGWVEIDVTPAVAASAGGKVTLAVTATKGRGAVFDSRESGADAPQLVLAAGPPAAAVSGVTIAAVGDAACPPKAPTGPVACHQTTVSDLIIDNPSATSVLLIGDLQYEHGELANFQTAYEASYGRLKAKTRPVPGNHEYDTPGAAGYYTYWGAQAGDPTKGYYSFDVGSTWHIVALNSNCSFVDCSAGSAQEQWLQNDLATSGRPCTIAYWHHPRFSSSVHGDEATVAPLWQALDAAGAELVLNGHDHIYERFDPQDAAGRATPDGLREITVGTGGVGLYPVIATKPNSLVRISKFGYLELTLGTADYAWRFLDERASVLDSGTGTCT